MEVLRRALLAGLALGLAQGLWAAPPFMLIPKGRVEMRSGAQGAWVAVSAPSPMQPGDEVRTVEQGTAEIDVPDGSKILLSRGTTFRLERADSSETMFSLPVGKLKAALTGLFSSRLRVRLPKAVCSVRGTVFEMSAAEDSSEVTMGDGLLEVQDEKGRQAVLSSEETLRIDAGGMGRPSLIALTDERALEAARPLVVRQETARDQTRAMLEELRNRELKANEAQLGKDVTDAFGRRVRLEEYLLRPAANEFKLVFLTLRESRFDWGHFLEKFKNPLPDDPGQWADIVEGTFLSPTMPANWLKYFEFYATNRIDADKETITLGDPVPIDFSGFGLVDPIRYYPETIDFVQTLSGPGVPGGSRVQFQLTQDWDISNAGLFTWDQKVVDNTGTLDTLVRATLDPSDPFDVAVGGCGGGPCPIDRTCDTGSCDLTIDPTTVASYPSGPDKADFLVETSYADGSTFSARKILVSNDGEVLDFANAAADTFTKEGSHNLEIVLKSNLYQGRDIDVLIAPEILSQKKTGTTTPDRLNPQ